MPPLKDKKKKKPRPRRLGSKPSGRQMAPVFRTGMNRDIPMGGAGGSQNLIANLLASRQAQPVVQPAQVIQTPDQFKLAQDIKAIRADQLLAEQENRRLYNDLYLPGGLSGGYRKPGKMMEPEKIMEKYVEEDMAKMKSAGGARQRPMSAAPEQAKPETDLRTVAGGATEKIKVKRQTKAAIKKAEEEAKQATMLSMAAEASATLPLSGEGAGASAASAGIPMAGVNYPADPGAEMYPGYYENVQGRAGHKVATGLKLKPDGRLASNAPDYSGSLVGEEPV